MNASQIYRLYLKASHLRGQTRQAMIEKATVETLRPNGAEVQRILLHFVDKPHKLILNQGNAQRMVEIAGDDISKWAAHMVKLTPSKTTKGQPTIILTKGDPEGDQS